MNTETDKILSLKTHSFKMKLKWNILDVTKYFTIFQKYIYLGRWLTHGGQFLLNVCSTATDNGTLSEVFSYLNLSVRWAEWVAQALFKLCRRLTSLSLTGSLYTNSLTRSRSGVRLLSFSRWTWSHIITFLVRRIYQVHITRVTKTAAFFIPSVFPYVSGPQWAPMSWLGQTPSAPPQPPLPSWPVCSVALWIPHRSEIQTTNNQTDMIRIQIWSLC